MEKRFYRQAFLVTLPVFAGYLVLGMAFGVLFARAGFDAPLAALMSLVVYGGSMQFAAVPMLSAHMGLFQIALLSVVINMRHVVYGLSLLEKFRAAKKWKYYLIFTLTDETYALLVNTEIPQGAPPGRYMAAIAFLDHCYWILGGVLGAVAGTMFDFNARGIEFTMTALFTVILVELCLKRQNLRPAVIGLGATSAMRLICGAQQMLIPALLTMIGLLLLLKPWLGKKEEVAP